MLLSVLELLRLVWALDSPQPELWPVPHVTRVAVREDFMLLFLLCSLWPHSQEDGRNALGCRSRYVWSPGLSSLWGCFPETILGVMEWGVLSLQRALGLPVVTLCSSELCSLGTSLVACLACPQDKKLSSLHLHTQALTVTVVKPVPKMKNKSQPLLSPCCGLVWCLMGRLHERPP